ncbi:bifunctional diaminohydroxyphosphoribosylaminopyrimidine deaminase/5-amino-6-(5-phosphoribosylamino)uracil reductase RibD [Tenacibaculum sp. M341]|nr:bifunctional diaminohydroxyphosphoribosylaminopyrimidine deaminase/5-amino-6-(5-phosphoribosylamino)uracil reductase RibD [Tenacibaculum sp. M341]TCI91158.1 bifunctional diaminohydroxyphosphoribosylaminopyrimidine deaminase/5-amino-6-(5-phosphoribosylamino)uracil reductase RibD [Tenacibaculum sp. M341]
MRRCIELAERGIGTARPNPSVGAVIVHNNKIIGEGFTSEYGGPHAEVNAVKSVKDTSLLKEATIYVTLEPCSHFGKTPPCANMIVDNGIPNVVIGTVDTNSLVAGKGINILESNGCNVTIGVLEEECKQQHKRFFTVQNKKRPYIILKWAQTQDNFIAPKEKLENRPIWISNEFSKQLVHKWRSEEHAILVGTNTAIDDNPLLNVRSWYGNNPVRIVIDKKLKLQHHLNIFNKEVKTIVITGENKPNEDNLLYETIDFTKDVASQICEVLQKNKIQSIIIEGGTQTLQTFINANLWDEARVFTGENSFLEGIKAPILNLVPTFEQKIQSDILRTYIND